MANRICSIEGCEKASAKRGWCSMHYQRWRVHGSTSDDVVSHTWTKVGSPCAVCGGEVPAGIGRRKHCSEACKSVEVWHRGKGNRDPRVNPNRPETAVCILCGESFALGRRTDGRLQRTDTKWCRDCGRTSPDANRFKRHGVTPERYAAAMLKGCEICGTKTALHIDHDHKCCPPEKFRKCGKCVRGFLCGGCNRALGMLRDDPAVVAKAAKYLRSWSAV